MVGNVARVAAGGSANEGNTMEDDDWWQELDSCGCGNPNARPPCSYCTRQVDEDEMDEWEDIEDDDYVMPKRRVFDILNKPLPTKTNWEDKYNALMAEFSEFKKNATQRLREEIYEEQLEEMESYARSEIYADLERDLWDEVRKVEGPKIRERLEETLRGELLAEVRQEWLAKVNEAKDKI